MMVGDRVLVKLHNGYETYGVVVRIFKNGAVRLHEANGVRINRNAEDVRPIPNGPLGTLVLEATCMWSQGLGGTGSRE